MLKSQASCQRFFLPGNNKVVGNRFNCIMHIKINYGWYILNILFYSNGLDICTVFQISGKLKLIMADDWRIMWVKFQKLDYISQELRSELEFDLSNFV